MHARRNKWTLPILSGALCAVVLCAGLWAAPVLPSADGAAFLGTAVCAPTAAAAAAQQLADEQYDGAAQASTVPQEDNDAAFWTQLPTDRELAAAPPVSAAQSEPQQEQEEEPIPEGMAAILRAHYEQGTGEHYIQSGAATVRNCTTLSAGEVAAEMMQPLPFAIVPDSTEPQVLIMHTHATETYELEDKSWCDPAFSARSTDTGINMVAVGAQIAAELNAAGICTVQDTTLHDYPSYNGSYAKSNATVRDYLARYPSIKVVLDVHRDAIQREDGTRVKPVAEINGQTAAQVMIICGADVDGNLPNFKQNLRFASRWQDKMESMFPGLTRPVLFDYRYYNQDLTTGSLLIEMGGHANTLAEAQYAGQLVGKALAALLREG